MSERLTPTSKNNLLYCIVDCHSEKVLAFTREFNGQKVLSLNNLSGDKVTVSVPLDFSQTNGVENLAEVETGLIDFTRITLQPFEFHWLKI